jgi:salicylate hydroxylase
LHVAVVGAGIAGLTITVLLRRHGVRCELFEQSSGLSAVGAGIQLSPNGVRILRQLGAGPVLDRQGVLANSIETRRWDDGTLLSRVPHGHACEELFGAPYCMIHRADLQRSLVDLLPPGSAALGRRIVRVTQRQDCAELLLADGGRAHADVVIGADGIHSVVRGAVVADERRFSGYAVCRGLVSAATVPSFGDDPRVLFWLGNERHVTYYPISASQTVHFSAVSAVPDDPTPGRVDVDAFVASFDGWHQDVRSVMSAADSVTRWGLFDRDIADRYCGTRLALVGDAAHPMLPYLSQGANQALEDAVTLVDCLVDDARDGTDPGPALRRYEELRMPRTAEVHRQSRSRAETFHLADGPQQRARDAVLAEQQNLEHLEWLYGYDPETVVDMK